MARLLAESIDGVAVDHDIIRSAILDGNIPFDQAAKIAYGINWALSEDIMKQKRSVIIDSTCNYQETLDRGTALARRYDYDYWYVECSVDDLDLLMKGSVGELRFGVSEEAWIVRRPTPSAPTTAVTLERSSGAIRIVPTGIGMLSLWIRLAAQRSGGMTY